MNARWIMLVLLAGLARGCALPGATTPAGPPPAAPGPDNHPQTAEVQQLLGRVEELKNRNDRLAGQLAKLEFLNEQLTKQLEAVGDAPRQRDQLKLRIIEQEALIEELRRQLGQLLGLPSRPASAPAATAPAATAGALENSSPIE